MVLVLVQAVLVKTNCLPHPPTKVLPALLLVLLQVPHPGQAQQPVRAPLVDGGVWAVAAAAVIVEAAWTKAKLGAIKAKDHPTAPLDLLGQGGPAHFPSQGPSQLTNTFETFSGSLTLKARSKNKSCPGCWAKWSEAGHCKHLFSSAHLTLLDFSVGRKFYITGTVVGFSERRAKKCASNAVLQE